jgi:Autotransporter beta-domain
MSGCARRWTCIVIAVAGCHLFDAGNAGFAVSPTDDSAIANPMDPNVDGPLLTADKRFTSAASDQSGRSFRRKLEADGGDRPAPVRGVRLSDARLLESSAVDAEALQVHLPANDFADDGPGTVKFAMSGLDVDAQRSVAGGRVHMIAAANQRSRSLVEARMSWLFEYLQTESGSTSFFAPGDKGIFAMQGLNYGSNWLLLGGGVRWELSERMSAHAGYDAQVNSQQMFYIGSGTFRYAW